MRAMTLAGVACGVCAAVTASLVAQAPQSVFRAGVDLVQLDVSVLDKDRKPVHGLTAADFTILEDGKPQSISAFQAFDIPDPVIPKTTWMREVAPDVATNAPFHGRMVVVLFNDNVTRSNYWSEHTAARIADKVLDQIGPDDLVAVTYLARNTTAQSLTNDRSLIRAAFTNLHDKTPPPLSMKGICPGGGTVEELLRIADALKGEPAIRKAILYVAPGFPVFPTRDPCVNAEMADFVRATRQSNISVYPIDPGIFLGGRGVTGMSAEQRGPTPAITLAFPGIVSSRAGGLEGLRYLADTTGGRAIINDQYDNPEAEVPAIFEENKSYYLLGFQSTNPKIDDHFRTLTVTVNRPGVTVHTRTGYVPGPPKAKKRPALTPLEQAETGTLPATQVPLRLVAAPIWVPGKKGAAVAVTVGAQQAAGTPAQATHINVLTAAFDIEGKSQGELRQRFDLPAAGDGARQYEVLSRLDLPPGRYDLRVATEDDAGRRGSVFTSVDVPDFTKSHLALSGAALTRESAVLVTPRDAFARLLPIVPTTERSFTRSDRVQAFLQVYEGSGSPRLATVTATITDAAERRVLDRTTELAAAQFMRSKSVDYRVDLPLATLEPGPYLLTVKASADAGKATAERNVRFEVK